MMTHRTLAAASALCLLAMTTPALTGCATTDSRTTKMDAPSALTDLGLDIDNPYGSVRVEVTDSVKEIKIHETLFTPAFSTQDTRDALAAKVELLNERIEHGPGLQSIRVRVVALEPILQGEGINLSIKLPVCNGIRVRNTAGDATLLGVTGAIQVETTDGAIDVRCDSPLRWPVALITDSGSIHLQTPGDDEGRVELVSNSGKAVFTSTLEPLAGMTATTHQVRGVLGGGVNPITLRSDTGDVRMMVIEDPMGYTKWKTGNRRVATPEKYKDDSGG